MSWIEEQPKRILTVEGARTDEFLSVFETLDQTVEPVALEFVTSKHALHKVGHVDGVLLMGGRDIAPQLYGQRRGPYTQLSDPHRDGLEYALATAALVQGIPLLGICRGMQMMAAVGGGTLTQHLSEHHLAAHRTRPHRLKWAKGKLGSILPRLEVNSYHHQAVKTVPRGFEVVAQAPDGVIEAIYKPGALGIQWHAESMVGFDPAWLGVFGWFLDGLGTARVAQREAVC